MSALVFKRGRPIVLANPASGPAPEVLPLHFLGALKISLQADAALWSAFTGGVWLRQKPPNRTPPPYLVINSYQEHLPGDTMDDEHIIVHMTVFGPTSLTGGPDQVGTKSLADQLRAYLGTPERPNPDRAALRWQSGEERYSMLFDSDTDMPKRLLPGGLMAYTEDVAVQFCVNRNPLTLN